jgi:glycosyltransferase involved in cell wall biosynthesis
MSKPRILIVENSIAVTGALKSILRSSFYLKDNFEFLFLIPKRSKAGRFIQEWGFDFYELPMREIRKNFIDLIFYFPFLLINAIRLFSIVKRNKAELILLNDFYNLVPAFYKLLGGKVPYISYVRFLPSKFSPWIVRFWMTFHNHYAFSIIAVSQAVRKDLLSSRNVLIVYNEIPNEEIEYTAPKEKVLLYPANYIAGKGQEFALSSFALIQDQFPEWRLRFVGGDMGLSRNAKFKTELISTAKSLGLAYKVEMLGYRDLMAEEYMRSAIVLNFSESESFSLTCLEGLYFGRPVIATRSGGPEEIIDDGLTGLLVPIGDLEAMADAMKFLMKNPDRLKEMGCEGFKRSRIKFDREIIKEKLNSAYTAALKN